MARGKKKENLTLEEKLTAALVPEDEQPYEVPENWCWVKIGEIRVRRKPSQRPRTATCCVRILLPRLKRNCHTVLVRQPHHLSLDPFYPGLNTHEIPEMTKRYGVKVWQSYLENNKPAAGRFYWSYGPKKDEITITGLEPHPNTKSNSYRKIKLSDMNEE